MSDQQNQHQPPKSLEPIPAYNIREGGNGKTYWNRIGVAFEHHDGLGHNIELDSLPVDGKITLRKQADKALANRDPAYSNPAPAAAPRQSQGYEQER